eukprot:1302825-Alexandrium_andersonii.AAC.1
MPGLLVRRPLGVQKGRDLGRERNPVQVAPGQKPVERALREPPDLLPHSALDSRRGVEEHSLP